MCSHLALNLQRSSCLFLPRAVAENLFMLICYFEKIKGNEMKANLKHYIIHSLESSEFFVMQKFPVKQKVLRCTEVVWSKEHKVSIYENLNSMSARLSIIKGVKQ